MHDFQMARGVARALAALLVAVTSAGTALAQDAQPDAPTVVVDNYRFAPAEVWVVAGGDVSWTNNQAGTPHSITSADGLWDSGEVDPSGTFVMTFSDVGDFVYSCTIHPSMQGVVHVVDDASEIPATSSAASSTPVASPAAAAPTPAPTAAAPAAPTPVPMTASQPAPAPAPRPTSPPPGRYSYPY